MSEPRHYVTLTELDEKLDTIRKEIPTRWEVRFLILAGMIAAQVVPGSDIAKAAIEVVVR